MRDDTPRFQSSGPTPDLIQQFLAGECSPEEERAIRLWAGAMPDGIALADMVRDIVRERAESPAGAEASAANRLWDALRLRLQLSGATGAPHTVEQGRIAASRIRAIPKANMRSVHARQLSSRVAAWAAGIVAAVAVVGAVLVLFASRHPTGAVRSYATSMGEHARITLDDGTVVTLAPQSTLRVSDGAGSVRTVSLTGEAYFSVTHITGAPFVVRTGSITTHVLGTAFDVRRYAADRETQVAVAEGKVVVSATTAAHPSVTLAAGMVGIVSDSVARTTSTDSVGRYTAWTRGMLVFHDVAATEVLAALSRWYGYEFRVKDSALTAQLITAEFSTRSSSEALGNLGSLLNADVSVDSNVVTLRPGRRSHAPTRERDRREMVNPKTLEVGR